MKGRNREYRQWKDHRYEVKHKSSDEQLKPGTIESNDKRQRRPDQICRRTEKELELKAR